MIADEMWPPLSEKQRALGEGIKAFSETDQTDDLKAITVPTLVMRASAAAAQMAEVAMGKSAAPTGSRCAAHKV